MIHYKIFPFTELQWKLPSSEEPSRNSYHDQTHQNQTSKLILFIQTFVLSSNQYVAAQSVQWLEYTLEYLGFKSWQQQENYLFSKTSRPAPVSTQTPTQGKPKFISGSEVASADSLTTHTHLGAKFKTSGAVPPFNVSLHCKHWDKFILPSSSTYVHISQEVTSFLVL